MKNCNNHKQTKYRKKLNMGDRMTIDLTHKYTMVNHLDMNYRLTFIKHLMNYSKKIKVIKNNQWI